MKTRIFILIGLLCAALAGLQAVHAQRTTVTNALKYQSISPQSTTKPPSTFAPNSNAGGRLVVRRIANFASNLALRLWIDGKPVTNIGRGEHFDSFISAGDHVLTVQAVGPGSCRPPWSTRLTVEPGQTYFFTGVFDSDQAVLRRSASSPP